MFHVLAARMKRLRTLDARMFLNIGRVEDDTRSDVELFREFSDRFRRSGGPAPTRGFPPGA